jgi:two-component system, response regulator PdtaR
MRWSASAAMTIEDAGFKVYEASSADQAVRMLEQSDDIRVLFTDIDMPGSMDGIALAHYVRVHWRFIKIIVTSGHRMIKSHDLPREAVFLDKPYRPDHIVETIREIAA